MRPKRGRTLTHLLSHADAFPTDTAAAAAPSTRSETVTRTRTPNRAIGRLRRWRSTNEQREKLRSGERGGKMTRLALTNARLRH